jgi:hypothetical protein
MCPCPLRTRSAGRGSSAWSEPVSIQVVPAPTPSGLAQMLGGDRQLAGDLAAALALGLGDLHGVTGLAASARSRASFSFSMK